MVCVFFLIVHKAAQHLFTLSFFGYVDMKSNGFFHHLTVHFIIDWTCWIMVSSVMHESSEVKLMLSLTSRVRSHHSSQAPDGLSWAYKRRPLFFLHTTTLVIGQGRRRPFEYQQTTRTLWVWKRTWSHQWITECTDNYCWMMVLGQTAIRTMHSRRRTARSTQQPSKWTR